ncbi:ketoacyl-ACP synthase III [bacterium]|nr:ketoacyl-ACP synthase III [bacterium]
MGTHSGIVGVGSYLPEKILTNFDLEKIVDTSDEWIRTRTGIEERHIAADDEATSDLSYNAAKEALEMSGIKPEELDMIIVGTVGPDYAFPATAALVAHRLGAKNAVGFDLEAACAAFVTGLTVGDGMIRSGLMKNVLVIGVELLTRISDFTDRNTCVLFGDGAGAAVLAPVAEGEGLLAHFLKSNGAGGEFLIQPGGGTRNPATRETVEKRMHYVHMDGQEVYKNAVRGMVEAAKSVIEQAGYTSNDVDLLVPHQANIRIMEAVRKRLKIPAEKTVINIAKMANTSSATIPICLADAVKEGRLKKGDLVLTTTFGAGFTWGANLIRWSF